MGEQFVSSGAGPVGLFLANQLKKRAPELEVILREQRPEYVRDNQLSIHRSSLTKNAKRVKDTLEKNTTAQLNAAHETPGMRHIWPWLRRVVRLPANVFERIQREEALARGVKIIYRPVQSFEQLVREHPDCRYFGATDGTHSKLRKELLGPDDVALERKPIQASIDVQYMVHGQAKPTRVATYDKSEYMVAETIGKEQNGMSKVGLRFLVDQKTFDAFPQADASKPLGWRELPHAFMGHIHNFQHIRKEHTGEEVMRGIEHIKVAKVQLSCYAAKQFAVTRKADDGRDVAVFFAGNSALAVPWYKSVNLGLKMASQLAQVIANPTTSFNDKVNEYQALREPIVTNAFNAAAQKLKYVQLYRAKIRPRLKLLKTAPIALPLAVAFAAVVVVGYIPFKIYTKLNPNARLM